MTRSATAATDKLTAHFVAEIRRAVADRNIKHRELAELTGLTESRVAQILNGYNSPTLRTVGRIAVALGIDVIFAKSRKSA